MELLLISAEAALAMLEDTDRHFYIQCFKLIKSSVQKHIQIYQQMGLESDNYPHVFKTGTLSHADNYHHFQQDFLTTLDTQADLFIANIFPSQALIASQIDLDQCFIPTHQTFTAKQLPHLCPLFNDQLLFDEQLPNRQQKLRFIAEYCVYLGLKRVAVRLNVKQRHSILSSLQNIAKSLRKGRIGVIVIVQASAATEAEQQLVWESYVQLRRCLKQGTSLQLCVELGPNLPLKRILHRWLGQHISYISLHQDTFILNNKGYPVLSSAHEQTVKQFMKTHVNLIFSHHNLLTVPLKQPYFKYLGFILQKMVKTWTKRDISALRLQDYLQAPLQPYIDNLDGQVYDIFQFDSPKYDEYEVAFVNVLKTFTEDRPCISYYVGSGKGLILTRLMNACKTAGKRVKVYCIQKNPYPLQTLKRRIQRNKWGKYVEIVQADIKEYVMPETPDLIFSELLGGLGDNELSPECVRWAEKNATASTRFVPEKYTAYIRPVSCHKLHKQLTKNDLQSYYTVNFGQHYSPFNSKSIWSFQHPLKEEDTLQRSCKLHWQVKQKLAIHGFQGSFDCNLFENSFFTIVPQFSKTDFYSWFPLYFPFRDEQLVKQGDKITIQIQRKSNQKQVWYQWRYQIQTSDGIVRKQTTWHNEQGQTAILLNEE